MRTPNLLLAALLGTLAPALRADPWERVGLRLLLEELGPGAPGGETLAIAQIEADPAAAHTFRVADLLREVLPGALEPDVRSSADFFARALLRSDADFAGEPRRVPGDIQIHSWVADRNPGVPPEMVSKILRAFDYQLQRDGVLAVASLRNERGDGPPDLLSHAYNAIIVGVSNGRHSAGLTRFDDPGRGKPDLVAPAEHTSLAVPMVAGCAGLLLELARNHADLAAAAQPEALKALLLAGADRSAFPAWDHTPSRPLDERLGAGELNIWNSHHLLAAGSPPADEAREAGWRVLDIPAGGLVLVPVHVEKGLAAALCWLREVRDTDPGAAFAPDVRLPNHDLYLIDASGRTLEQSRSTVDNVEFVRHAAAAPGTHTLVIRSDLGGRVALAWRPES